MLASLAAPRDLLIEPLNKFAESLKLRKAGHGGRARLMVMGAKLDNPAYIRTIESQGALVVADRFCPGALPNALEPIQVAGDPYYNLAEHYLRHTVCARMMEKRDERIAQILKLIEEYRVDGVIIEVLKFCDIWNIDTITVLEALRQAGIPVMRLEREYQPSGEGQLITRTQAFLESIESRRATVGQQACQA
jgi:benzoyl-CoA reductase/2-hydroxyglutaryl-CoA dehydratase subunit BcrC/BadD/HgdB